MKATMNADGVITLQAETSVEAYALQHWEREALIPRGDIVRAELTVWRGSMLRLDARAPDARSIRED